MTNNSDAGSLILQPRPAFRPPLFRQPVPSFQPAPHRQPAPPRLLAPPRQLSKPRRPSPPPQPQPALQQHPSGQTPTSSPTSTSKDTPDQVDQHVSAGENSNLFSGGVESRLRENNFWNRKCLLSRSCNFVYKRISD